MTATIHSIRPDHDPVAYSIQHKLVSYQRVWREWGAVLDINEQIVALQLIDRTIGWGRREAYFTSKDMIAGDGVYPGMPISRRTLYRTLASLEKRGIIRRRKDRSVPDRVHFTVNMDWSPDMGLNVPKRLQTQCHTGTTRCHCGTTPCQCGTLYTGITKQVSPSNITGSPVPGSHPQNPAEKVRGIVNQSQHAQAATARRTTRIERNTAEGVENAWRTSLAEHHPLAVEPAWTGREKGQAKRAVSGWGQMRQIAFIDFVEWAVMNWTAIMRKQFKWMKKSPPPAVPAFSFFIAMLDQFADCWSEGTLEAWLSDKERTKLERLMARGMTYEQATAEIAKGEVAAALRGEMTEREINVRARERSAEFKEQRAKKLAEFSGNAPIHPRSKAAMELKAQVSKSATPRPVEPQDELTPLSAPVVPMRNPFD